MNSDEASIAGDQGQKPLTSGAQIGSYRIECQLGEGGMGTVYRALDTKLNRPVALKVLSDDLADAAARRRFQREAKMASSLNHPHILTVHDASEFEGQQYLVTEFVDGGTLKDWSKAEKRTWRQIVELLVGVADGLAAAHVAGITHRDIKPANILVAKNGYAKVADFGLAKLAEGAMSEDVTRTLTGEPTRAGVIVGTIPYMSPEQASGKPLDARSDIFSFGVVLYELLAGRRPFEGATDLETLQTIIHGIAQPLGPDVPLALRMAVEKALEKAPDERYQSMRDLVVDLRRLSRQSAETPAPAVAPRPKRNWRWAAAALTLIVLAGSALILFRFQHPTAPARLEYTQLTNFADSATSSALSPDGRMLTFIRGEETFIGPGQIYVKLLPDGEPVELTHDDLDKMSPKFFPDGARIAYTVGLAGRQTWEVWAVPVLGGQPRRMLANAAALTWIEDGAGPPRILFSEMTGRGVQMALVTSTESRAESRNVYVPTGTGMAHRSYLSPDHKWVLLAEMKGAWLPCRLVPYDGSSFGKAVGPSPAECTDAAWSPDGRWMYFSVNTGSAFHIWRQRFPDGKPEQVTSGATEEEGISFAPDGRSFVTSVGSSQSTVWVHDSRGDRQVTSEGYAFLPSLSADGKKLFYVLRTGVQWHFARGALWTLDLESGQRDRLLPDFLMEQYNVSSDGKRLVFISADAAGRSSIWAATLDGRSAPRRLTSQYATGAFFGADGDVIFLGEEHGSSFIYRVKEDGSGLQKVVSNPVEFLYSVSPDGKWVAAWVNGSTEETQNSVMVYPLGDGSPVTVCAGGCATMGGPSRGHRPPLVSWSPDEKFLYFTLGGYTSGRTYAVPLQPGQSLPTLPPSGLRSPEDVAALSGARLVSKQLVFCGPNPSVYTSSPVATHRNIYRIPVP